MKNIRILSFILTLVLAVSICGCTKNDDKNIDGSKAALVNKNGRYYIQLENEIENVNVGCGIARYVDFSSMDEFYSRVTESNFSEKELDIIRGFYQDDNGIVVCNMDKLYQLVLPNDADVEKIAWQGYEYLVHWNSPCVTQGLAFMFNSDVRFESEMRSALSDDFFERENIKVLDYEEIQDTDYEAKKWTYYNLKATDKSAKRLIEVYENHNSDIYKKVIIKSKIDRSEGDTVTDGSDAVPYEVDVFIKQDGWYCWNLMTKMDSPLDIDWLMSFDIEPYVTE